MGNHENEMVNKPRHFVSISMRVQGATYAAFLMALSGTRLNKGFLDIFLHLKFYVDWFVLTGLAYTLIDFVIAKTDSFDDMLHWKVNLEKRLSYQFWFLCFFPYTVCELFDLLYLQLMDRTLFRSPYKIYEIPTSLTFLLILNAVYPLAKNLMTGTKEGIEGAGEMAQDFDSVGIVDKDAIATPITPTDSPKMVPTEFTTDELVVFGGRNGKTKVIKSADIATIIQQHGVNTIFTFSQETYTCLGTLKALYEPLDKKNFFKANKNAVIHRNAVSEVEPRDDGGLLIHSKPYYDQAIGISHHERKTFTTWYTKPIKSLGKLIMLPL